MVEEYLNDQFKLTGWPYVRLVKLINELKKDKPVEEIRAELNQLFIEKKIAKKEGIAGYLIFIMDKKLTNEKT